MNPRLAWHIFRKDTRCWGWMIALSLALLARLTWLDAGRHYQVTGAAEGWLYLLLPLTWSFLIALAVMEDPVVGEGPFWMAAPCGWRPVLAAKMMFAGAFVHLPYFIACCVIVQARGFSPAECLPELLYKQLALLALTLPSLAIASVVRNAGQFMMIAIVLATAVAAPSIQHDRSAAQDVRIGLLMLVVVIAGAVIALRQYGLRMTVQSRWIGGTALVVATVIWWMPRQSFYGLWSVLSPSEPRPLAIHLAEAAPGVNHPLQSWRPLRVLWIPIGAGGYRGQVQLDQAELSITDAGGRSYRAAVHPEPGEAPSLIALICCGVQPQWQEIVIDPNLLQRIGDGPVTIRGTALAQYQRSPQTRWIAAEGREFVPNFGWCSNDIQWGDGNPNNAKLHVGCESPYRLPFVDVTAADPAKGREWPEGFTVEDAFVSYLRDSWLSPMQRMDKFFPSTDESSYLRMGGKWSIPRDELTSVRVGITPGIPEGSRIVRYETPNIRLKDFEGTE